MKVIHLTDTHLVGDDANLFGINPKTALKKALLSIQKNHSDAEFIAITGDLSHNGKVESYFELQDLLKHIEIPVHLLLGNHDMKYEFNKVFDVCKNSKFVQYEKIIDEKVFLFLSTNIEFEEYGTLCDERLQFLEMKLQEYVDNDVYIFMHHFPLDSGLPWMEENASFINKNKFWSIVVKYPNVKHIFAGHLHRIISANFMGIGVNCTRSTNFQVAYTPNIQEDFITNEEKPCYEIINIHKESILIHNHEFLDEDKVYIPNGY